MRKGMPTLGSTDRVGATRHRARRVWRQGSRALAATFTSAAIAVACSSSSGPDIEGVWAVESMVVGGAPYPLPDPARSPIVLFEDGRVFGDGFCNDFRGTYRLGGADLDFDGLLLTAQLCSVPPGVMEADKELFDALTEGFVVARGEGPETLVLTGRTTTLHLTRTDRRPTGV